MNAIRSQSVCLGPDKPLTLDCGAVLSPVTIAYETYGELNEARSNAILVCHALSGDQYAASSHPITAKPGWWAAIVGPGRIVDTDRYFVICANVLGGCMGTTGPSSLDPATGEPYGMTFPVVTIRDMVRLQKALVDELGIEKLACVMGGSMGGMQALQWAADYPDMVGSLVMAASALRHSAQNIALHEIGRQAIMADPDWRGGDYARHQVQPEQGLSVARMLGHVSYLSPESLTRKFGRRLQDREEVTFSYDADFQVESYLRYQGSRFVERFDANCYLAITRAMDYFDILPQGTDPEMVFPATKALVVSFSTDWLFPTSDSLEIAAALRGAGGDVRQIEVESDRGHDAFLLDEPVFHAELRAFLNEVMA